MSFIDSNIRLSGLGGTVRAPAVAGAFYPADRFALGAMVESLLADARCRPETAAPKALIAPHAGYVYSGPVAATAYKLLRPLAQTATRVILLGPAHRVAVRGLAVPSVHRFRTPLGDILLDRQAIQKICDLPQVQINDAAHEREHSLEVHLPFLQAVLPEFSLVPIVVGHAAPGAVAEVIEPLWGGPETLIVISTDLSHYHDYATACRIDAETCSAIESFRFEDIGPEQACGCMPMAGLLLLARKGGLQIERLDLRNSGDTAGSRDQVVGYAAFALRGGERIGTGDDDGMLLELARSSIAHGLRTGHPLEPGTGDYPPRLHAPAAVFVTLMLHSRLRGCIGTTEPVAPLVRAVADNAFKAAFNDPRFPALTLMEFRETRVSLSLLGAKEPLAFRTEADLLSQLQPGIHGLVIARDKRNATFLPSVWEMAPAREQFLAQLKLKAGLNENESPTHAWRYTARHISD
ncbi:MAG: AmmeMemoRadiSam system protein B [Gammaproteobacteria bacterium]|nr:AmmeMemoRadiSam system protein B [Gammaproteobacteria bacterium]